MELLFVAVISAALGLGIRYLIPGRNTYGVVLLPAVATAVGMVVWVALLWLGFTFDGGWIWVISIAAAVLAAGAVALLLPRARHADDTRLRHSLGL
ncbi:hypothetical protein [Diaminobutyricimonas sp. TR449]|uniref:hypothetical protein n=1 Tax=Diaminobutyricimonas sp. TR449 TaxID=2708076 RepID=UPI00141DB0F0|nr:hypothetical protein [Diaminobutyricimonas sp. TR449]